MLNISPISSNINKHYDVPVEPNSSLSNMRLEFLVYFHSLAQLFTYYLFAAISFMLLQ